MLAMVGKRFFVERLHDNFDLFFEDLTVGVVVGVRAGYAKGIHLPGVVSPSDSEDYAAFGENVGRGIVLRQAQWPLSVRAVVRADG